MEIDLVQILSVWSACLTSGPFLHITTHTAEIKYLPNITLVSTYRAKNYLPMDSPEVFQGGIVSSQNISFLLEWIIRISFSCLLWSYSTLSRHKCCQVTRAHMNKQTEKEVCWRYREVFPTFSFKSREEEIQGRRRGDKPNLQTQ